jgi:hypothetical protein
LEWHAAAALLAVLGTAGWPHGAGLAAAMIGLSLLVAGLQAVQAAIPRAHDGWRLRLLIALLCYAQPLVRSWARYRARLVAHRAVPGLSADDGAAGPLPLWRPLHRAYWDDRWRDRTELLRRGADELTALRWAKDIDSGWSDWDLEFSRDPWTVVRVASVQEDHGSGRRLFRLRYDLKPEGLVAVALGLTGLACALAAASGAWPAAAGTAAVAGVAIASWCRGARRAAGVVAAFDRAALEMGLVRVDEGRPAGARGTEPTRAHDHA